MTDLPERIRAFIAVRIPQAVIAQLVSAQEQLKRKFNDVSWTRAEAMHVTLQFLGNIQSARFAEMEAALKQATERIPAFEIELTGLGSFGNRVLWAGITRGAQPLAELAESVRRAMKGFGVHEEERAFNAHVTLGRFRRPHPGVTVRLRELARRDFGSWRVQEIELIRSELSPHGARYTTLAIAPLARL